MKISVVTVCRDAATTIEVTVRSFLEQTYPDKELLIIDGMSRDNTLDVVRSFSNSQIRIISESDRGIYDAMNKGLRAFSGDAVGFLNADDAFHDDQSLARIASALSDADAVYGDLVMVEDHYSRKIVRKWNAEPRAAFCTGWMPPHPTFYIRRELAEKTGFFDLNYRISSDYDFMLRALELHSARARHVPHTLINFMVGGMSTAGLGAVIRGNVECLRSRRRHLGAPFLDTALVTKPLRKIRQLCIR